MITEPINKTYYVLDNKRRRFNINLDLISLYFESEREMI
jgi:hypothetical protein